MGVQTLGFPLDAELLERLPVAIEVDTAHVQHRLRPLLCPVHAGPLHPVLDVVATRPLDHPRRDRVAPRQEVVVTQPPAVLQQIYRRRCRTDWWQKSSAMMIVSCDMRMAGLIQARGALVVCDLPGIAGIVPEPWTGIVKPPRGIAPGPLACQ